SALSLAVALTLVLALTDSVAASALSYNSTSSGSGSGSSVAARSAKATATRSAALATISSSPCSSPMPIPALLKTPGVSTVGWLQPGTAGAVEKLYATTAPMSSAVTRVSDEVNDVPSSLPVCVSASTIGLLWSTPE